MQSSARRSTALLAIAAALVLTACTAGPTSTPAPTDQPGSATPTPTPSPAPAADPLTTVTAIVVRPEHLDLVDAEGTVVTTLSYDAQVTEFVDTITTVLDEAPEQADHAGGMETAPWTEYRWAGFTARDDHEDQVPTEGGEVYGPFEMNLTVSFTAPVIGDDVAVRTITGFQPGGDAEALAAELGQTWHGNGYDQLRVETGEPIGEQEPYSDEENAYSVAVNAWEVDGVANSIYAPWNFGIGHV